MEKEHKFEKSIKELKRVIMDEKGVEFYSEIKRQIKEKEQDDFMKGYCYAIQILEESMQKKK